MNLKPLISIAPILRVICKSPFGRKIAILWWRYLSALVLALPAYAQSPDDGFNPGSNGQVYALAMQVHSRAKGRIVVGGAFTQLGGQSQQSYRAPGISSKRKGRKVNPLALKLQPSASCAASGATFCPWRGLSPELSTS
jgi:hypothetical protein